MGRLLALLKKYVYNLPLGSLSNATILGQPEKIVRDKHTSFFGSCISDKEKSLVTINTRSVDLLRTQVKSDTIDHGGGDGVIVSKGRQYSSNIYSCNIFQSN